MVNAFSERSLQVCRDFLQTAVIIDDRAFDKPSTSTPIIGQEPKRGAQPSKNIHKTTAKNEHYLDTQVLIKSFADHGIICSALKFTDFKEDYDSFHNTAKLADIAIIDWEMEEEKTGDNALRLISSLLEDDFSNPQRLRLVSIYTATEDLADISQKVVAHIKKKHNKAPNIEQDRLLLVYQSIVITIYAKNSRGIPDHFRSNVVGEDGLAEKLVACFSESISGILPNTALSAITAIRQSTHRLLAQFDKDLDFAFLTHRASLPKPDDSTSHLETLIAEEIKSILSSYNCIGSNASFPAIRSWVEEQYTKNHEFVYPNAPKLTRDEILNCLKTGSEKADISISKTKTKQLYQHFSNLLQGEQPIPSRCDLTLSKLSILKTRYQNAPPHLTLGVVLRQPKDKSLWICIQPKCDSVRLGGESKKFPLLPIFPGKGGKSTLPNLYVNETEPFCHIPIHPQNCQSIEFISARKDQSQILPKREKKKWFFRTSKKGCRFEFVTEFKDEIIQNILSDFAATTARVATNPSEWLRKSGLEK